MALLLLQSLPLVARRRFPIAVLAVTFGATLLHVLLASSNVNEGLGSIVALYTVAERRDRRTSLIATLVVASLFAAVIVSLGGLPEGLQGLFQTILVVWLAWALGDLARTRGLYATAIEDRNRLLEVERDEKARQAVADERTGSPGSCMTYRPHRNVMVLQAGAGLRAWTAAREARNALEAMERVGRDALTELDRVVAVLGAASDTDDAGAEARGRGPARSRPQDDQAAGLQVELSVEVGRPTRAPGIELSAYRIVQEALTNALKHGRGAGVRAVALRAACARGRDRGRRRLGRDATPATARTGRGLLGMRERAALFGGRVEPGRTRPGSGSRRLPIAGEAAPVACDPRPAGGRPGPRPRRVPDRSSTTRGHRGRRRGGRRAGGHRSRPATGAGRRGDGYPDAAASTGSRRPAVSCAIGSAGARVLVLTTFDADEYVVEALRAGASGFLLKDVTPGRFRDRAAGRGRRRRAARAGRHPPSPRSLCRSAAARNDARHATWLS